jgi:peptidoglycan hydrolase CwlO-like protein
MMIILLLVGAALSVALAFAAWLNKEREFDISTLKGDTKSHFSAIEGRLLEAEKRINSIDIGLVGLENLIESLQESLDRTQAVIDSSNDEIFSVKSALQALGDTLSQKKKKVKKAGKKR